MNYFTFENNQVSGPYPLEDIQLKVQRGELNISDQVCPEGTQTWLPLSTVLQQVRPAGVIATAAPVVAKKKSFGCTGCLIAGAVTFVLLAVALVFTGRYLLFNTAVPFRWLISAFLPPGSTVDGVSGSVSSGFSIQSIRWRGPNGEPCEINDVRFKSSGIDDLTKHHQLIISEISVGKAHLYVSSDPHSTQNNFHWHSSGSGRISPFQGSSGKSSLQLLRIDRIHFGDIYVKDVQSGFEFSMPTLDYTGFNYENGKTDLGILSIVSDRLEVRTEPGRTFQMGDKRVLFQKELNGTAKPRLSNSIKQPIDFSLDLGFGENQEFIWRLEAFSHRLIAYSDATGGEYYRAMDLPLSSYLSIEPWDLPSKINLDGKVPAGQYPAADQVTPPKGDFVIGATDFVFAPEVVPVNQSGYRYHYEIKARQKTAGQELIASLIYQSEEPRVRLAFSSNPPMPPQDLLATIFYGQPYAALGQAERQQIDTKIPVYFPPAATPAEPENH